MGKIFGISDNPVSTIGSALQPLTSKKVTQSVTVVNKIETKSDKFISKNKPNKSNAFVKMRNGIGRLMSHFSKAKQS